MDNFADLLMDGPRRSRTARIVFALAANFGVYSLGWIGIAMTLAVADWLGTPRSVPPSQASTLVAISIAFVFEFGLTNGPVKSLVGRSRPVDPAVTDVEPSWVRKPRTSSFPSGHASAATLAVLLLFGLDWVGVSVVALAILVMASRVYFRFHHLTDILGGILLGVVYGIGARILLF